MAAGAVSAFRQLGYAVGVAVLGSVFRAALEHSLEHKIPDATATAEALTGGHAAQVIAQTADGALVPAAFASGLNAATTTAGAIAVAAAVAAIVLMGRSRAAHPAPAPISEPARR